MADTSPKPEIAGIREYPELRYTRLVADLPSTVPFVGPETQERRRGRDFKARIGANESVFGPSPRAIAAMAAAAGEMWMYCDPENHDLKTALAKFHGVGPENILVGEGIDAILGNVVRLFVEPGDVVVSSLGAYPTFNFHVAGFGGRLVRPAYTEDRENPDAVIAEARLNRAKLAYFANPDNPMGTWWNSDVIQRMASNVPEGTLLLLDEAYCDTAPVGALAPFDVNNRRLLRLRTFSKAYGLAGLRVGYAIGEAGVVKSFDKIRNHFGVNRMAQVAALAALADQAYLKDTVGRIASARAEIARIAKGCDLKPIESATNFVTIDCGGDGTLARRVLDELIARDVFVRMPGVPPLDRCIRISAGLPADLALFGEVLPACVAAARG